MLNSTRARFRRNRNGEWMFKDGIDRLTVTGIEIVKSSGKAVLMVDISHDEFVGRIGRGRRAKKDIVTSTKTLVGIAPSFD
jgi:hypothetical protein